MGKLTISMAIFHSYVKLPEGSWVSDIFQRCHFSTCWQNINASRIVGWVDWLEGFESAASRDFLGLKLANYSNSRKGSIVDRTLLCYLFFGVHDILQPRKSQWLGLQIRALDNVQPS